MKRTEIRTSIVFLVIALVTGGCDVTWPFSAPPSTPSPDPTPVVLLITPNLGSTGGGAPTRLIGSGFSSTTTVTFGGVSVRGRTDSRDPSGTLLYLESPPHAPGIVDVVLSNPGSKALTLRRAYTYAQPGAFDFNGNWSGFGNAGQDIPIIFIIENDVVTSASCDEYATLTFSPPLEVKNGEFSYSGAEGVSVTGRIVSAYNAVGTINLYPCTNTTWLAGR